MADSTNFALPNAQEFFAPGGMLASAGSIRFEPRPGQLKMAVAVEQAFAGSTNLIAEAGTGTGKTMAYLYPAIRYALNTGERVIVSTGTKALQEQIFFKDIPMLHKAVGDFKVCYLKGRSNYLCLEKFDAVRKNDLIPDELREYNVIGSWLEMTETGDRAELSVLPESSALWKRINGRGDACTGKKCSRYEDCFVNTARDEANDADIVIVNHHLFFADLVVRMKNPMASILPPAAAVVFDEAHELESVASESFGVSVSNRRIAELTSDVYRALAGYREAEGIFKICEELTQRFSDLLLMLPGPQKAERTIFNARADFLNKYPVLYKGVLTSLDKLHKELQQVRNSDEAFLLSERVKVIVPELRYLFESDDTVTVVWLERRPSLKPGVFNTHITATPIAVADILRTTLFANFEAVVLCSATLAVQNKFDHVRKTLGIDKADDLIVPSPFHYKTQAALYLPPNMPDPRTENTFERSREVIEQVLTVSNGRAFCLFTSYEAMIRMHAALDEKIPFPILLHGSMSRKELLDRFRTTPNAVLFGTSSFWQGVDVQGDQLSCVIIDKLPFAVPSDPIVIARTKAIEKAGGNGFFDYQIPHAVIALKQGFGRLVRSTYDRGILVILDPRIQHPRYGHVFLNSLPSYTITNDLKVASEFLRPAKVVKKK
jgi:ATP-dependent DNA helicase DinG